MPALSCCTVVPWSGHCYDHRLLLANEGIEAHTGNVSLWQKMPFKLEWDRDLFICFSCSLWRHLFCQELQ